MRTVLSRHRFDLLALLVAGLFCVLLGRVESSPAIGLVSGGAAPAPLLIRGVHVLEGRVTDVQFRLRGPRAPHPDVLVVAVDERSVQQHGRWPWPRETLALALDHLRDAGAAAIGLDMAFTDADPSDASRVRAEALGLLDRVQRESPQAFTAAPALGAWREAWTRQGLETGDGTLAAALGRTPRVVQGVIVYPSADRALFADQERQRAALLEPHLLRDFFSPLTPGARLPGDFATVPGWRNHSAQLPLPELARAHTRLGFFSAVPDADGTLRRLPPLAKLEGPGGFLPSLDVQVAAAYLGAEAVEPLLDPDTGRLEGLRLRRAHHAHRFVPLPASEPFVLINYPGDSSVFPTLGLGDVVDGRFDPASVRGKAVLVGLTLTGNFDQRVTPFRELEPGVFVHAALLSNILRQDFLTRPALAWRLEAAFMLAAAWLLARLMARARTSWMLAAAGLLVVAYLGVDQFLFTLGLQVSTVLPVASLGATAVGLLFLGYLTVDQEKARLRHAFQHYLDSSVMEQVLAHPERLKLGGERKELTVLFSDIRGFTSLSERLPPERLVALVNEYLTPMTDTVFQHGGTLDKYIGDAVMCFWGAPVDQPDHALRACRAALAFLDVLRDLNARWRAAGLTEVDIGVGLHTGFMNVGHMGTRDRFNYTVMGDAVNLASRLEGLNKEYGTRILVSEATHALVKDHVTLRRLGAVRVKGKREPVGLYELRGLGPPSPEEAAVLATFEDALARYTRRDWDGARAGFQSVLARWPDDTVCPRYLEALDSFRLQPPSEDWDGVFTATTK